MVTDKNVINVVDFIQKAYNKLPISCHERLFVISEGVDIADLEAGYLAYCVVKDN